MKFCESMVMWKPNSSNVMVVPIWNGPGRRPQEDDEKKNYPYWFSGRDSRYRGLSALRTKLIVYIEAIHLIVRDKVDPKSVHKAFLAIDEYVDGLADDVEGVNR